MKITVEPILLNENVEVKFLHYEDHDLNDLKLSLLTKEERQRMNEFKSHKRQLEFYFARYLWQQFESYDPSLFIHYNENGKPCTRQGHISISHSQNVIAIGYSTHETIGIDIEHFSEKIKRIAPKFLSYQERTTFDCKDLTTITTMWSVKEAVYKLDLERGMSFSKQINIKAVGEENLVAIKTDRFTGTLKFNRLIFESFVLTYCMTNKI